MANSPGDQKTKTGKKSGGSIDRFLTKDKSTTPTSNKCLSSTLSPLEDEQSKKATMSTPTSNSTTAKEDQSSSPNSNSALKNIIEPLIEEMRKLRESVHQDIQDLQTVVSNQQKDLTRLEECLTDSQN